MGSGNDSNVTVAKDVEDRRGNDSPSSVHTGELSDAPHENYTQEESRLLVRKLDWHVSHCESLKLRTAPC